MTSIVSDPSSLTKDKLKNELIKHNITLPSSDARKNVYVELYRKHFLQRKHSEFSSDEETSPVGVSKQKKTVKVRRSLSPRKPSKQKKMATDVAQFTDDELAARLREFGVDVGPILDSTRKVYQRKLAALLSGKVKAEPIATNDNEFSASDEDVEDSQDTEIIEEGGQDEVTERLAEYRANKQEGNRTTYRTITSTTVTSRRGIRQDRRYEHDDWRQTSLKSVDNASSTSQQEGEPPAKPAKRWLSIKVQIIILIIVAIFIFLVVQNMDPAPKNPVSGKLENKQ